MALLMVIGAVSAHAFGLPRAGVVCDASQRICYDRNGPSVDQTRRTYGERAGRDLLRQISGRPPAMDFQLSSGEVCDLRQRICWDDGWGRRNKSNRLTRALFGSGTGINQPPNVGGRSCQLSQQGRRLFDGTCTLYQRNDFDGPSYVVDTRDGRSYVFRNRAGRLVLRDATGVWPVSFYDRGSTVTFRWANLQLDVGRGWGRGTPSLAPASTGQVIEEVMGTLFR